MNYRHAFHAGNFADVHKHSILARVLLHLRLKPAAFRVIDTHAGSGRYDLFGSEATRSGEWHQGIERVWRAREAGAVHDLIKPYLDVVAALNPGGELAHLSRLAADRPKSPARAGSFDRLRTRTGVGQGACGNAAGRPACQGAEDRRLDGCGAYVPPPERRGLVLIDPPFEEAADFTHLSNILAVAHRKWPTGIYLLWYPIKDREAPDALARRLRKLSVPNILRSELTIGPPRAEGGLIGSGLVVVNPPFTLERDLRSLMPDLCRCCRRMRPPGPIGWRRSASRGGRGSARAPIVSD